MNKRPVGWILTGLLVAGVTALATPGCGRSLAGEYQRICVASCEAGDDCEDYAGFTAVDRDDCIEDCSDQALDFEDDVLDDCDDGVDIDGAQVDRCHEAVSRLGASCREDDESEINEAVLDIVDECPQGELYRCR
jgi:hypothetical protein